MEYKKTYIVTDEHIDLNNHLNNVVYHVWMEDVALEHTNFHNGFDIVAQENAMWVAKTQHLDYVAEGFLGDEITVTTGIESHTKITAKRIYEFKNSKGITLVKAYTDWVYIDRDRRKPKRMSDIVFEYLKKSMLNN